MSGETDSVARVTARDLFMILMRFKMSDETTLENVRLHFCVNRKVKLRSDQLWSTARDTVSELQRLGFVEGAPSPKNPKQYSTMRNDAVTLTSEGRAMISLFTRSRADAYDQLFMRMYARHPYVRAFVTTILAGPILAPVLSSWKDHVSDKYSSATVLIEDVLAGKFDVEDLFVKLGKRLSQELSLEAKSEIAAGIKAALKKSKALAIKDDSRTFAKNFINRLNDVVIPAVFRSAGLGFDFRTHRTLWAIGQEFRLWYVTRSHPEFDGWLIFPTATINLTGDQSEVTSLNFSSGIKQTGENFLDRLYAAYQAVQAIRKTTFVPAWELRAVFCYQNRCQASVFNQLFAANYLDSDEYELHLEIERQRPRHEKEPLKAGRTSVGSMRVSRR